MLGRRAAIAARLLVLISLAASVWLALAPTAQATHTSHGWAGSWSTNLSGGSVCTLQGVICVRDVIGFARGQSSAAELTQMGGSPCAAPTQYYGDDNSQARLFDVSACTLGNETRLLGRVRVRKTGVVYLLDVSRNGPSSFQGTWGGITVIGRFERHFAGDGAAGSERHTDYPEFRFTLSYYVPGATVRLVQPALGGPLNCKPEPGQATGSVTGSVLAKAFNAARGNSYERPMANLPVSRTRCVGWSIPFELITGTLHVVALPRAPRGQLNDATRPSRRVLTARVRISGGSGNVLWGCAAGTEGTLTMTDSDRYIQGKALHGDSFRLGGWNKFCLAHRQAFSNFAPTAGKRLPNGGPGPKVYVWIGCLPVSGPGGFSPRNCPRTG